MKDLQDEEDENERLAKASYRAQKLGLFA